MTIQKLMISGIRSYNSKYKSVIEFFTPLTLIVGKNGTGKTTIIESLRYVLTGDLPSNSKGGAFIYDPKISREVDTKAQVRLKFKNRKNEEFLIIRSLQLTQKSNTQQQKTLENLLSKRVNDKYESISGKIGDIDKSVEAITNISKPLIENIILCSQEDSAWYLAEPGVIKKRLDDIFNSTKYIKALDKLKELKKTKQQDLKLIKQEIEFLKKNKDKKVDLVTEYKNIEKKQNVYNGFVEELTHKILEKEKEVNNFTLKIKEIDVLEQNKNQNKIKIEKLKEDLKIIKFVEVKIEELSFAKENNLKGSLNTNENVIELFEKEVIIETKNITSLNSSLDDIKKEIQKHDIILKKIINEKDKENNLKKFIQEMSNIKNEINNILEDLLNREIKLRIINKEITQSILKEKDEKRDKIIELLNKSLISLKDNSEINCSFLDNSMVNTNESNISLNKLKNNLITYFTSKSNIKNYYSELMVVYYDKIKIFENEEQLKKKIELNIHKIIGEIKYLCNENIDYDNISNSISELDNKIKNNLVELKNKIYLKDIDDKEDDQIENIKKYKKYIQDKIDIIKKKIDQYYVNYETNIKIKNINERKEYIKKELGNNTIEKLETRKKELVTNKRQISSEEFDTIIHELLEIEREIKNYNRDLGTSFVNDIRYEKESIDIYNLKEENIIDIEKQNEELKNINKNIIRSDSATSIYLGFKRLAEEREECPLCNTNFKDNSKADTILTLINKIDGILQKIEERKSLQRNKLDSIQNSNDNIEKINKLIERKNELIKIVNLHKDYHIKKSKITSEEELKQIYEKIGYFKELEEIECKLNKIPKSNELSEIKILNNGDLLNILQEKIFNYSVEDLKKILDFLNSIENNLKELKSNYIIKSKMENLKDLKSKNIDTNTTKNNLENILNKINEYKFIFLHKYEEYTKEKERLIKKHEEYIKIEEIVKKYNKTKENNVLNENILVIDNISYNLDTIDIKSLEENYSTLKNEYFNKKDIANSKIERKRNLEENIKYKKIKNKLDEIYNKYKEIKHLININIEDILKIYFSYKNNNNQNTIQCLLSLQKNLEAELQKLKEKKNVSIGEIRQLTYSIARYKNEINQYKNIDEDYFTAYVKNKIIENNIKDIEKMISSIDNGLVKYHSEKINEINQRLKSLWIECYKGNDIDYVELQSVQKNNNYNYKMVMIKNGAQLDLRGRCSAGQKVLLSILFRLSLLETFVTEHNLLALDEPTTNLDKDSIEALALLINQMVRNKTMQLIVITHDEEFVNLINTEEYFYRLDRDNNGDSRIEKIKR
ncbi:DNA repair protein RAD50 [Spraguea lophii 42_110]|uniref:DNA repair protein RAD50 n=1 Tax=Spraguea lophii (strain 42_110) TaxID=1358809 RepID=S7XI83_SPRLO|nr:DNA repair protein RAD50 [Spraguea lophii 42_110]